MVTYPGPILSDFLKNGERGCGADPGEISHARDKGIRKNKTGGGWVTKKQIEDSLNRQLELQGKKSEFYKDLVQDYMFYWKLKRDLIKDIKDRGLRYSAINGNGINVEKPNESVINLQKTTATMLKIMQDLNLKEPIHESDPESDYL